MTPALRTTSLSKKEKNSKLLTTREYTFFFFFLHIALIKNKAEKTPHKYISIIKKHDNLCQELMKQC